MLWKNYNDFDGNVDTDDAIKETSNKITYYFKKSLFLVFPVAEMLKSPKQLPSKANLGVSLLHQISPDNTDDDTDNIWRG